MQNLIIFFQRFRIFLLFALLQLIALSTYFTYLSIPRSQYLTTSSYVSGSILSVRNEITKHWDLSSNNYALQLENRKLRNQLPHTFIKLQNGEVKINDTLFQQQYSYTPAVVINSTHTKANNYFTLNIGKKQGIKRGMGVFSDKGVIGIVHIVSDHFSVVKSILTENINIDVMIESSGAFGLLKWKGDDARFGSISGISNDIVLNKGALVKTRGGSGIFPRGLSIGKVESFEPIEGKSIWNVTIRFSEDYRQVQNVYVIHNMLLDEQHALENQVQLNEKP
jgi:rod shape-determining protein MreC